MLRELHMQIGQPRGLADTMDELASLFTINNLPGHISYILIALSYWLTDIYWLRVMAVVGLTMEIVYFALSGGDLRTGIGWDLVFIAINLYQLYQLAKDRLSLKLPAADRELLRTALTGMSDVQIARLLSVGQFRDIEPGTTLTVEQQELKDLYFICSGTAKVTISGVGVSKLEKANFIGEVAFITGQPATATVVTETPVRALVFGRDKLNVLLVNEAEAAGPFYQLLGRELANKMKVSNSLLSAANARV